MYLQYSISIKRNGIHNKRSSVLSWNHYYKVFDNLLKEEGLLGPGLDIAVPFLGISYFTVGLLNIFAGLIFNITEANYILIVTGVAYHIGMAVVRSNLNIETANLYKSRMISKTNSMQYGIGILCTSIGILGYLYF